MVAQQMKEITGGVHLVTGDTTYNRPFSSSQHHQLPGCMKIWSSLSLKKFF